MNDTTPDGPIGILVVDDEKPLREALTAFLVKRGFDAFGAASGEEALETLTQRTPALVLLDIKMPGMSGLDVVSEALERDPELAILMLTGVTDATSAAICMQRGAYDYLTKPIELNDLSAAIDRALRRRDTALQTRGISTWLKEEVERRTQELEVQRRKFEDLTVATLEALVNALEAKSAWLSGHSARVAAFGASIASALELSDDQVETVRVAGRLHDLGKIGIRESVLEKQAELTPEERDHVRLHVVIGSQILAPLKQLEPILEIVLHHHEHWDGSGYPDGLAGEAIPIGARIIGAVEVYDALTHPRPYQDRRSPEDATEHMKALSGTVIDPAVMEAIERSVQRRQTLVFLTAMDDTD